MGTLLNLEGKSKYNLKARQDLQVMKIRPELYPIQLTNGKYEIPNAPYTLSSDEKTRLLAVLKHIRVPDGWKQFLLDHNGMMVVTLMRMSIYLVLRVNPKEWCKLLKFLN